MRVILLERVEKLGTIGDEVNVRPGFARNFLLPNHKALRATDENRARFEREREALEKLNAERREAAQSIATGVDGQSVSLIRQAGESGQLYGSVTSRDIADALASAGHHVARSQIDLNTAIKTIGLHTVRVRLHAEVDANVTVNIARTADEAERQLRGEDVIASQAEEDRAIADAQAAELFEASIENEEDGDNRPLRNAENDDE
jgi:large subunit ribosomal protein L9